MRSSTFNAQLTALWCRSTNWLAGLNLNIPVNAKECWRLTDFWATMHTLTPVEDYHIYVIHSKSKQNILESFRSDGWLGNILPQAASKTILHTEWCPVHIGRTTDLWKSVLSQFRQLNTMVQIQTVLFSCNEETLLSFFLEYWYSTNHPPLRTDQAGPWEPTNTLVRSIQSSS
jgi:hypothetical protein